MGMVLTGSGAGRAAERQREKVFPERMSRRSVSHGARAGQGTEPRWQDRERGGAPHRPFAGRGESRGRSGRSKRDSPFPGRDEVSRVL